VVEDAKPPLIAGGAATSAGILFEQHLGALFGAWMLADRPIDQRLNLAGATPIWIRFETEAPVDDILVATSSGGFLAIQAKTTAYVSRDIRSPFGKTVAQFVKHWRACRDGDGERYWDRPLHPMRDRLVLAVGAASPASLRIDLPATLRPSLPSSSSTSRVPIAERYSHCSTARLPTMAMPKAP
jgi:hypothetical protein